MEHFFVVVRVKMLVHWGKTANVQDILGKNPVIGNVPDECIGENMGKKIIDGSTKPISDVICGDLRGR